MAFCSTQDYEAVLLLVDQPDVALHVCNNFQVSTIGVTRSVLQYAFQNVEAARESAASAKISASRAYAAIEETRAALNVMFMLVAGYLISFMQAGFAMLCAGSVRSKNTVNMLLKNVIVSCIAGIFFYLWGFALAFRHKDASNLKPVIGRGNFALNNSTSPEWLGNRWAAFFYEWTFCATATTIVAGAVAERTTFISFLSSAVVMSSVTYPIAAHWFWDPSGYLSPRNSANRLFGTGILDIAGGGVVHMVGGVAGLVAAWMSGPRLERFDKAGHRLQLKGHSATLVVLGTFIVWFGFYGLNCGAVVQLAPPSQPVLVSRAAVATTLSAAASACAALALNYTQSRTWDLVTVCNGVIAGLVASAAGCAVITPWAALLLGILAAVAYLLADELLIRLHIDDPLHTFAVHGAGGALSLLFPAFFAQPEYVRLAYEPSASAAAARRWTGVVYGGDGRLLAAQLVGVLVVGVWTAGVMGVFYWGLSRLGKLRVSRQDEVTGLDVAQHGEQAYHHEAPIFAQAGGLVRRTGSRNVRGDGFSSGWAASSEGGVRCNEGGLGGVGAGKMQSAR